MMGGKRGGLGGVFHLFTTATEMFFGECMVWVRAEIWGLGKWKSCRGGGEEGVEAGGMRGIDDEDGHSQSC